MPGQIFLVRHGETEWSAAGKHTSRTDLPLTEDGRRRASLLADALADRTFSLVLSSPLRRARETCELAGLGNAVELCDDLREWDYGEYEGLTTPEIRSARPDWNLWRDGCPGGESPSQVGARADRALARLRSADGGDGGDRGDSGDGGDGRDGGNGGGGRDAIAFAHGHILRVLSARWIGMETAAGARLALSAGALCILGFERETEVLRLWNSTSG